MCWPNSNIPEFSKQYLLENRDIPQGKHLNNSCIGKINLDANGILRIRYFLRRYFAVIWYFQFLFFGGNFFLCKNFSFPLFCFCAVADIPSCSCQKCHNQSWLLRRSWKIIQLILLNGKLAKQKCFCGQNRWKRIYAVVQSTDIFDIPILRSISWNPN